MRININFASRKHELYRKVYLVLALGIAVGVFVFVSYYGGYKKDVEKNRRMAAEMRLLERHDSESSKRLAEARRTVSAEKLAAAAAQGEFANAAIRRKAFSWTRFLNRIEGVVPDGVGISTIRPDFTTLNIDISGTAVGMGQLTQFVEALTMSPYFEDVPPAFQTSDVEVDKDIGKTIQSFSLKIRYNTEGVVKANAAPAAGKKGDAGR